MRNESPSLKYTAVIAPLMVTRVSGSADDVEAARRIEAKTRVRTGAEPTQCTSMCQRLPCPSYTPLMLTLALDADLLPRVVQALGQSPLFASIAPEVLQKVAERGVLLQLEPGEVLVS